MKIIILAGGGGKRLYPLSTDEKPKQFLELIDGKSFIATTVGRFVKIVLQSDIIIVTGKKYEALTKNELISAGFDRVNIVCEPFAKNTAPAIALGVKYAMEKLSAKTNEAIFVVPSDHIIEPLEKYLEYVKIVKQSAESLESIISLGIVAKTPDTAYGYIKATDNKDIRKIEEFKEKPDRLTAQKYIESGNYFWNSGMFCFTENAFRKELKNNASKLFESYSLEFDKLYDVFETLESISFDYAIAEKTKEMYVVPMNLFWSDVGSWNAYYDFCEKDNNGNVIIGNVKYENCFGCLLFSGDESMSVMNQKGQAVILSRGRVVIIPLDKSQEIKQII